MDENILKKFQENGVTITHINNPSQVFDLSQYFGINFIDIITTKVDVYTAKYNNKPDILYLGWGTYLAILSNEAKESGIFDSNINQDKYLGLNVLVLETEHFLELGYSNNGVSVINYFKNRVRE